MVFKDNDGGTYLWCLCLISEIKSKLASFVDFLNIFFYSTEGMLYFIFFHTLGREPFIFAI